MTGEEAIRAIRKRSDTVLLAFSCGKDSIAAWLALRPHFRRIVPYYMYLVPDLEFVEAALRYYEDFFGEHIYRLPHPSFYRMLNFFVFTPPERCAVIEKQELPSIGYDQLADELREYLHLGPEVFQASGVRAADSPMRRAAVTKWGCINERRRSFWPVWDWNKARLLSELRAAKIRLPVDYRLFGRSFDGLDYRFLAPLKEHLPRDYARILEWFPLADLEIWRREHA